MLSSWELQHPTPARGLAMMRYPEWAKKWGPYFPRAGLEHLGVFAVIFVLTSVLTCSIAHLSAWHASAEFFLNALNRGISFILVLVFSKSGALAIGLSQAYMATQGTPEVAPVTSPLLIQALLFVTPLLCRWASFKLVAIDSNLTQLSIAKFVGLAVTYSLAQTLLSGMKSHMITGQLPHNHDLGNDLIINLAGIALAAIQLRILLSILRNTLGGVNY